uniref:Uncharacterized protein n=1 Tax=Anguilla anguilla TaxID=7936 RepID=A0A0E9QMB3_ANGAN
MLKVTHVKFGLICSKLANCS